MKAVIQNSDLSPSNPLHVAIFRLQCGMEYVSAAMFWYVGETVGRPPLPAYQSVVALSLYLAGTAEVLHLFHELARKQVLVPTTH